MPNKRNLTQLDKFNQNSFYGVVCRSYPSPLMGADISESLNGVSISTSIAQSRPSDSDIFSLGCGHIIETQTFSVLVLSLRLTSSQSQLGSIH